MRISVYVFDVLRLQTCKGLDKKENAASNLSRGKGRKQLASEQAPGPVGKRQKRYKKTSYNQKDRSFEPDHNEEN